MLGKYLNVNTLIIPWPVPCRNTMELQAKTESMATEIKAQGRVTLQLKEAIVGAEAEIRQQSVRIGYLEEEIARIT